jgi:hypothetical protein
MTATLPACPNERTIMSAKITGHSTGGNEHGATPPSSIESARRRLGGKPITPSTRAPGLPVQAVLRDRRKHTGVVLWSSERDCDVWFDDGVARRMRPSCILPYSGAVPDDLARVSAEARLFALLAPGELVRWQRPSGVAEGCIVEKCRYGAIIVTRDGRLVAVGFRRLWPAVVRPVA